MKLGKLLENLEYSLFTAAGEEVSDPAAREMLLSREIPSVTNDSRQVEEGSLFFCIRGANRDGHDFAQEVIEKKAAALLVEEIPALPGAARDGGAVLVKTKDTRLAMAFVSAAFYGHPAREMKVIGVTGTKGKTTTTYMIRDMLEAAGIPTGLIGTIEMTYKDVRRASGNTTPESLALQKDFREMADAGIRAVVMEVSSQALMLHRTQGFTFDIGVFTNLTPDHIGQNEHKDFAEYLAMKRRLFTQCREGVFNGDDPHLSEILEGHTCSVHTFGLKAGDDLYAQDLKLVRLPGALGIDFSLHGKIAEKAGIDPASRWEASLPGAFNVYNAMCAVEVCALLGAKPDAMKQALSACRVKGRIEIVPVSDAYTLLIDYAHNAVSLESVLKTLREYEPGRIVTVFGCGGNRDRNRRFEMGEVSGRLSDLTIITSDNPRFEEPLDIMADIRTGMEKTDGAYVEIADRKEAIRYAMENALPGDIVVLAGKGHEDYQEIRGVKHPMDERKLIREILAEGSARGTADE